jgi:SAM-dependent methyltransferase
VEGTFDLIMFHHSLEHISDQQETLRSAARRLHHSGHVLVRIPVVTSHAWQHYRENWVQLDAPRHLFLHSVRSLQLLAAGAGLEIADVRYDSTEFQFVGSERYARGISVNAPAHQCSRSELQRFRRLAEKLNARGEGDQAAFYLKKAAVA